MVDEVLARESRFVWEILCVETVSSCNTEEEYFGTALKQYEVGQHIINKPDPLMEEFIANKIAVERKIADNAGRSNSEDAAIQKKAAEEKIAMLEGIVKNVNR